MQATNRHPLFSLPPVFEVYVGRFTEGQPFPEYERVRGYYSLPLAVRFAEGWNACPDKTGEALVVNADTGDIVWNEEECQK